MKKGTLLQTAAALAAACLVFFALALWLRWDLLLSAVLAVGVYVGLSLLLSPRRDRSARFFASRADGAELSAVMEQAARDLKQVRLSAGRITDIKTRETAEHLADTSSRIYDYLRKHPEKIPSVHRFLTYCLDTMGRILVQYVAYQEAGLRTPEVLDFQRKVRAALPKLKEGFDQQLTQLMADERFDTEADMKVMETLLQTEGFPTWETSQE